MRVFPDFIIVGNEKASKKEEQWPLFVMCVTSCERFVDRRKPFFIYFFGGISLRFSISLFQKNDSNGRFWVILCCSVMHVHGIISSGYHAVVHLVPLNFSAAAFALLKTGILFGYFALVSLSVCEKKCVASLN